MSIQEPNVDFDGLFILDLRGREVRSEIFLSGNQLELDLNELQTGVYILQLRTSKGIINERIQKQ